MKPLLYVDYNATTPLDTTVLKAMQPALGEVWGNPSSIHQVGRKARAVLDEARERAAVQFHCKPSELIFTSGGTESNNLAICGAARSRKLKGKHLITSAVEHHAVLTTCQYIVKNDGFDLTVIPVDSDGRVDPNDVRRAIRPDTVLVSIMAANNEIGTLQPIVEIGDICRERGVLFHTDAVQWFGKESFSRIDQFHADLVTICAHKIHGPKGIGALYVRSPHTIDPLLLGGAHENEHRAGTENLAGILGLVTCIESFLTTPVFAPEKMSTLTGRLREILKNLDGVQIVTPTNGSLPNTLACVVERADSITLLAGLDIEGVCASSGSACSAGSLEPSHVIQAIGKPNLANGLLRFSFGRENSLSDLDHLESVLPEVIRRAQLSQ